MLIFGGEFYPKRAKDAMWVEFVDYQSNLAALQSPLPFVQGEKIKVRGRHHDVNLPKLSLTFPLFLAKGEAAQAASITFIYR
jgi:hypothetical protein